MVNSRCGKLRRGLLGVVCLTILILGFSFLLKFLSPDRINAIGKVTDIEGNPLAGVKVHAVPELVVVMGEPPIEKSDGREVKTTSDKNGLYQLKGLAGRCGWKELSYIQPYQITFELTGYRKKLINFKKPERSEDTSISVPDILLEKADFVIDNTHKNEL